MSGCQLEKSLLVYIRFATTRKVLFWRRFSGPRIGPSEQAVLWMILFLVGASEVYIRCCLTRWKLASYFLVSSDGLNVRGVSCCCRVCVFSRRWPAFIWMIVLKWLRWFGCASILGNLLIGMIHLLIHKDCSDYPREIMGNIHFVWIILPGF